MIKLVEIYNEIRLFSGKKINVFSDYKHGFKSHVIYLSNQKPIYVNIEKNGIVIIDVNKLIDIEKQLKVPHTKGYDSDNNEYWIEIDNKFVNFVDGINEIKLINKVTPEMIFNLVEKKLNNEDTYHTDNVLNIFDINGYQQEYGPNNYVSPSKWISNLSQSKLNKLYLDLLKLK